MITAAHKTEGVNRTETMRFCSFVFTGKDPRKGWRIPLNEIKYNEQRDAETGFGYFGARYMDHELMTMWLSVDPMADKYTGISPYAYCAWNPVKLVDPDGRDWYDVDKNGYIHKNEEKSKECMDKDVLYSITTDKRQEYQLGTIVSTSNDAKIKYKVVDNGNIKTVLATGSKVSINADFETSKSIFDFCISNTKYVEFSLFQTTNNDNAVDNWYLTTSHLNTTDPFSTGFGLWLAKNGHFFSHRHNHPYAGSKSTAVSMGDVNFINATTGYMQESTNNKSFLPTYYLSNYHDGKIKDYQFDHKQQVFK